MQHGHHAVAAHLKLVHSRLNSLANASAMAGSAKHHRITASIRIVTAMSALRSDAVASVKFVHSVEPITETAKRNDHIHEVREILARQPSRFVCLCSVSLWKLLVERLKFLQDLGEGFRRNANHSFVVKIDFTLAAWAGKFARCR